ncbi:MAG: hypothetical protein MRY21_04275 [Simkaniaceae bacterium]|nr:hypothetical protein [Simkaniaceae bacterium]
MDINAYGTSPTQPSSGGGQSAELKDFSASCSTLAGQLNQYVNTDQEFSQMKDDVNNFLSHVNQDLSAIPSGVQQGIDQVLTMFSSCQAQPPSHQIRMLTQMTSTVLNVVSNVYENGQPFSPQDVSSLSPERSTYTSQVKQFDDYFQSMDNNNEPSQPLIQESNYNLQLTEQFFQNSFASTSSMTPQASSLISDLKGCVGSADGLINGSQADFAGGIGVLAGIYHVLDMFSQ